MSKAKKVLKLIKKGHSHREIESITGVPITTISKIRNEAGMGVPSQDRKSSTLYAEVPSYGKKLGLNIGSGLQYKDGEVSPIDEDLTQLEAIVEKLRSKGIDIGGINYQGKQKHISNSLPPYRNGDPNNVLVVGDLHSHHIIDGYLEFCRKQQEKRNCGTVIYIGDIIDFASISYHEKTPEELNPQGEIAQARLVLQDWYKTFPKAYVCLGNHDMLPYRQAKSAGLLREFIQNPHSIFGAPPLYEFIDEIEICGVIYTHGTKGDAFTKCVKEGINLVQGHLHTKAGVQYHNNRQGNLFGMQVATGVDYKKKAFDYARCFASQPVVGCGVVINEGTLPIFLKM